MSDQENVAEIDEAEQAIEEAARQETLRAAADAEAAHESAILTALDSAQSSVLDPSPTL